MSIIACHKQKLHVMSWVELFNYHFELHLNYPPLHAYVDNLVQIYPKRVTRGIIPEDKKNYFPIILKSHKKESNYQFWSNGQYFLKEIYSPQYIELNSSIAALIILHHPSFVFENLILC